MREGLDEASQLIEGARYRKALEGSLETWLNRQHLPLSFTCDAEAEMLAEHTRLMNILTHLTGQGSEGEARSRASETGGKIVTETLVSVVDDDESVRDSTRILLRSAGYKVAVFESGELFLESDTVAETECLVLDMRMPGMDGLELQRRLSISEAGIPIVFVTAHDDERTRQLALEGGACDFFRKPFVASDFLISIRVAVAKHLYSQAHYRAAEAT